MTDKRSNETEVKVACDPTAAVEDANKNKGRHQKNDALCGWFINFFIFFTWRFNTRDATSDSKITHALWTIVTLVTTRAIYVIPVDADVEKSGFALGVAPESVESTLIA